MYICCQVDTHPLLHLPTSTHRVHPSPAQTATSHFHRSLRREARSLALVCPMTVCVPRHEMLQCCDSKPSPIRSALHGLVELLPVGWELGLAWPWGCCGTEQHESGGYLGFMARYFGGRKAGKSPTLLMLQGSTVSMATPPAFPSQG